MGGDGICCRLGAALEQLLSTSGIVDYTDSVRGHPETDSAVDAAGAGVTGVERVGAPEGEFKNQWSFPVALLRPMGAKTPDHGTFDALEAAKSANSGGIRWCENVVKGTGEPRTHDRPLHLGNVGSYKNIGSDSV